MIGIRKHTLYKIWLNLRYRCNNKNYPLFHRYGGRGISVCKEWDLYENFFAWAKDKYQRGLMLDRINNDEGYGPYNCRFVTPKESANNRDHYTPAAIETRDKGIHAMRKYWVGIYGDSKTRTHKKCPICKVLKGVGFFSIRKSKSKKINSYCKSCKNKAARVKYAEDKRTGVSR